MATNLKDQIAAVSDAKGAQIELIKAATTTILKIENNEYPADEDAKSIVARNNDAKKILVDGAHQLRVVEIAPLIKEFLNQTADEPFREALLKIIENKTRSSGRNLTEEVIDSLAFANIQEDIILQESVKLNKQVFSKLKAEAIFVGQAIEVLTDLQKYYPAENKSANIFTLSILQLSGLDQFIIENTQKFLASDKKDPQVASVLLTFVGQLEDTDTYHALATELFDLQTNDGKVQYLEDALDAAAEKEDGDTAVKHPILARFGSTYDELFSATGRAGGVKELLGINTPLASQRSLAWD